jgi:hypothetical protein
VLADEHQAMEAPPATIGERRVRLRIDCRIVQPKDANSRQIELPHPRRDDLEPVQEFGRQAPFELAAHDLDPARGFFRKLVPSDRH